MIVAEYMSEMNGVKPDDMMRNSIELLNADSDERAVFIRLLPNLKSDMNFILDYISRIGSQPWTRLPARR